MLAGTCWGNWLCDYSRIEPKPNRIQLNSGAGHSEWQLSFQTSNCELNCPSWRCTCSGRYNQSNEESFFQFLRLSFSQFRLNCKNGEGYWQANTHLSLSIPLAHSWSLNSDEPVFFIMIQYGATFFLICINCIKRSIAFNEHFCFSYWKQIRSNPLEINTNMYIYFYPDNFLESCQPLPTH